MQRRLCAAGCARVLHTPKMNWLGGAWAARTWRESTSRLVAHVGAALSARLIRAASSVNWMLVWILVCIGSQPSAPSPVASSAAAASTATSWSLETSSRLALLRSAMLPSARSRFRWSPREAPSRSPTVGALVAGDKSDGAWGGARCRILVLTTGTVASLGVVAFQGKGISSPTAIHAHLS